MTAMVSQRDLVRDEVSLAMTETNAPRTADEYLKRAADCRQLSERAPNQAYRESWLDVATNWERLAGVAQRHS
jgi:hypothetical protein